jgi:CubicO group peptidase (beta-lactamase class C family)
MKRRDFITRSVVAPVLAAGASHTKPAATSETKPFSSPRQVRDERFEAVARVVYGKMAEHKVPGVALGVFKDGQTLTRGFGIANLESPEQRVTPDTLFPLASLSKTVAATAIMRLVEQGKVRLDAPVQTYLPTFRVLDPVASREVTVRHLLTHTPGWEGQLTAADHGLFSLEFFADSLKELPQLAPPGAVWSYNNAGFTLAGRVIEVASGSDIHTALRDLVFRPLGMTRAFTRMGDVVSYAFTQGHRTTQVGSIEVVRPFALSNSVTAGGVAMSLSDLMSYARFHLGETGTARAGVLSRESLDEMRRPQLVKNATSDEMGIGWHLRRVGGVQTLMHGGTAGAGHRLLVELVPERGLAFAILTNQSDGWRVVEAAERAILRAYESVALAPNQPICHRGINEDMTSHATPLETQPSLAQYAGRYVRPPSGAVEVREEEGGLVLGSGGAGSGGTRLVFYGPDVAYVASGGSVGTPYEFIRTPAGEVGWIRNNGRIAKKEA